MTETPEPRVGRGAFRRGLNCPTGYYTIKGTTSLRNRVGAMYHFDKTLDPLADNVKALNFGVKALAVKFNEILGTHLSIYNGVFNESFDKAAREVQTRLFVPGGADGLVGPNTCKAMWKNDVFDMEITHHIPYHLLFKVLSLETSFDPGAVGILTPDDKGIAQINMPSHETVKLREAFDPIFAFNYAGKLLFGHYAYITSHYPHVTLVDAWHMAVVAYNSPKRARAWAATGVPSPAALDYLEAVLNQRVPA